MVGKMEIKHQINWNIDVAKILMIIGVFILILLGYKQFDLTNKVDAIESKVDKLDAQISSIDLYKPDNTAIFEIYNKTKCKETPCECASWGCALFCYECEK